MEYFIYFCLFLCFSQLVFQLIPHLSSPSLSLSPCYAAGRSLVPSPFSLFCHPPSHHLTSPWIFPSFSSSSPLSILPPLTPFSSHLLLPSLLVWSFLIHLSEVTPNCSLPLSLLCSHHPSILWWPSSFPPPFAFSHYLFHYLCLPIHLSPSIYLSIIYLWVFISLFALPFISTSRSSLLSPVISLSTSLSNSTYLPSLLPFDTASPCPLIQSSLLYFPAPPSLLSLVQSLPPSLPSLFLSLSIYLHQSLFSDVSDCLSNESYFSYDLTLFIHLHQNCSILGKNLNTKNLLSKKHTSKTNFYGSCNKITTSTSATNNKNDCSQNKHISIYIYTFKIKLQKKM